MPKYYYDVYYQTATERNLVASIQCEILQTDTTQNNIKIKIIKHYKVKGYGKPIIIALPQTTKTFTDFDINNKILLEQKLLQFIQSCMQGDNRVKQKLVLDRIVPVPTDILVKSVYFDRFAQPKIMKSKGKRNSNQTSNRVNEQYEPSQSELKLPCDNIQQTIAYGYGINFIAGMGERSNASQKNKGDIAEMVSLPFTCQIGPDGKYIRNYLVTGGYELENLYGSFVGEEPYIRKIPELVLSYVPLQKITPKIKQKYEEFKEGVYYQMIMPTNDFTKRKPYMISSNVPAADNSITIYTISEDHLIFIVRQDKIGYDTEDLVNMITNGIIKMVDAINTWQQFKKYKIELIYTLAWSRKQNKRQRLIPPPLNAQDKFLSMLIRCILSYVIVHFEGPYYEKIMERVQVSFFVENCLSHNVIRDSAAIYQQMSKDYPEYEKECENTEKALLQLIDNKKFNDLFDTAQYEIFLPAKSIMHDYGLVESYIKKISLPCLQQRMLDGFKKYKDLYNQQQEESEYSALNATTIKTENSSEEICYLTSDDVDSYYIDCDDSDVESC